MRWLNLLGDNHCCLLHKMFAEEAQCLGVEDDAN